MSRFVIIYTHLHTVHACMRAFVSACLHKYVFMYVCIHACIYIYVHVCMHISLYVYACTTTPPNLAQIKEFYTALACLKRAV